MTTAVEWERNHAGNLKAMAEAMAENDPYLADEILNKIVPYPEGENVHVESSTDNTQAGRLVEVFDPVSNRIDNPNGPAVIEGNGTRKWFRAGLKHNASGPAVIKLTGEIKYYYLGTQCKTAAELDEIVAKAERHYENSTHIHNVAD